MKFKTIFILFNIVIIASFIIIFFMPLFMLGWEYTAVFWQKNWFLPILFIAVLVLLNTYFLLNLRLFQLLEAEDWENLITYLEEKVYQKKKFQPQHTRLLINTYLVRSDIESIKKLELFLREHKPELLSKFALGFGIPYLLQNESEKMERYFEEFLGKKRNEEGRWIRWNYAFSLFLQKREEEVKQQLLPLIDEAKEPVLRLLTVYLLKAYDQDNLINEKVSGVKDDLTSTFTREQWEQEVVKAKNDIQVLVLSRLIDEAGNWLFDTERGR